MELTVCIILQKNMYLWKLNVKTYYRAKFHGLTIIVSQDEVGGYLCDWFLIKSLTFPHDRVNPVFSIRSKHSSLPGSILEIKFP